MKYKSTHIEEQVAYIAKLKYKITRLSCVIAVEPHKTSLATIQDQQRYAKAFLNAYSTLKEESDK